MDKLNLQTDIGHIAGKGLSMNRRELVNQELPRQQSQ